MQFTQTLEKHVRDKVLAALGPQGHFEEAAEQTAQGEAPLDFNARAQLFARLTRWRRDLEEADKLCREHLAELEPGLLEEMALNGVERLTVEGLTLYPRVDRAVNKLPEKDGVTTQDICEALRAGGWGDMIADGYSAATLKARVVECLNAEINQNEVTELVRQGLPEEAARLVSAGVPEGVARLIRVVEITRLVGVKASR